MPSETRRPRSDIREVNDRPDSGDGRRSDSGKLEPDTTPSSSSSSSSSTSSKVMSTEGAGLVVGLMGFTVLFALIGQEIKNVEKNQSAAAASTGSVTTGGRIIIGGVIATALLVMMTHAGNAGRQVAIGLSLVAAATTTLVNGKPVWDAMSNTFGSKPTNATLGVTGGTSAGGPTAPVPAGAPQLGPAIPNPYLYPTS